MIAVFSSNTLKSLLTPISRSTISGVMRRLSSGREIITFSSSDIRRTKVSTDVLSYHRA